MGNCRCDLASHLAQDLRTIHVVMAQISSMAVMAIRVFNIIVIAVLILWQTVPRLEALSDDDPSHDKNKQHKHKGNHGGLSGQYQGYDEAL